MWLILPEHCQAPVSLSVNSGLEDFHYHFSSRVQLLQDGLACREHNATMVLRRFFQDFVSRMYSHPLCWPLFPDNRNWRIEHVGRLSAPFSFQWQTSPHSTTDQLHTASRMPQTNHSKTESLRTIAIVITHKSTVGWLLLLILVRPGQVFLWLQGEIRRGKELEPILQ